MLCDYILQRGYVVRKLHRAARTAKQQIELWFAQYPKLMFIANEIPFHCYETLLFLMCSKKRIGLWVTNEKEQI